MCKFTMNTLNAIGVILTVLVMAYITVYISKNLNDGYDVIVLFIGGGVTSLIGYTLIGTIFK